MFDLDKIEQDWKENSFCLSEEEIIEIYHSEDATLRKYEEEIDEYIKKVNICCGGHELSAEERLLRAIFGEETLEEKEKKQKIIDAIPKPKKKYLSKENQKKVVEGSLYLVFDATRGWYNFFNGKLSMEQIYYICLEALMNSVKYMLHCEKPVFHSYVDKSIERNMIKHVAKYMHITYREAYEEIHYNLLDYEDVNSRQKFNENLSFAFYNKNVEEPEKPSKIYYQLRNEYYDMNYIKNISSTEFMEDYQLALEKLDEDARKVMQFTFDSYGHRGLTNAEIADYLGIDSTKISTIRRRGMRALRKDYQLKRYLY